MSKPMNNSQTLEIIKENELDKEIQSMVKLTPIQRANMLKTALAKTAEAIIKCAKIVNAMDIAGDNLSGVPTSILSFLRRINCGQVRAQVFVQYDGMLRQKIASLPIINQDELLNDGKVKVFNFNEKNKILSREVDPRTLEPFQIRQVFGTGYIRDEAQQISFLESHKQTQTLEPFNIENLIRVDKKKNKIIISGPIELTSKELSSYLNQLI